MAEVDGQGERRRGLEGTLGRIARQLKVGSGGFPSPIIYVPDEDFDFEAEAAKHSGAVIFLPKVDDEPQGIAEEQAYWDARRRSDEDGDREAS